MNPVSTIATIAAGVLVGSVSGITGTVIGAWMTGKSQMATLRINIDAENGRRKRDERRILYSGFLTTLTEVIGLLKYYPTDISGSELEKSAFVKLDKAYIPLINAVNDLILLGPHEVIEAAREMMDYIQSCIRRARKDGNPKYDESVMNPLYSKLSKEMRGDITQSKT
jgi:hypothetical protein